MILSFLYMVFIHILGWLAIPLAFYGLIALFFRKTRIHGFSILLPGLIAGGICFASFWLIATLIVDEKSSIKAVQGFLWAGTGFSLIGYPIAFFGGFLQIVWSFFNSIKNKTAI